MTCNGQADRESNAVQWPKDPDRAFLLTLHLGTEDRRGCEINKTLDSGHVDPLWLKRKFVAKAGGSLHSSVPAFNPDGRSCSAARHISVSFRLLRTIMVHPVLFLWRQPPRHLTVCSFVFYGSYLLVAYSTVQGIELSYFCVDRPRFGSHNDAKTMMGSNRESTLSQDDSGKFHRLRQYTARAKYSFVILFAGYRYSEQNRPKTSVTSSW